MKKLITVKNNDSGLNKLINMDLDWKMDRVRTELLKNGIMIATEQFVSNDADLDAENEKEIALEEFLTDSATEKIGSTLIVGHVGPAKLDPSDPTRNVNHWEELTVPQKKTLLSTLVFKGLVINENGFERVGKNTANWNTATLQESRPIISTMVRSDFSFSETTIQLKVNDVESASVSLDTPYGGGEAEYSHEKSKETNSGKVKEHLMAKYTVRKILIGVDEGEMELEPGFTDALKKVIKEDDDTEDAAVKLIDFLDQWGYYVPKKVILGGSLFSKNTTEITTFSQAETEKTSFGVSFKVAFEGIGGGAAYKNAHGTENTNSSTNKATTIEINQIGGLPGTQNDYSEWMKSLDSANNWDVAAFSALVPTLKLLCKKEPNLANTCAELLANFGTYKSVFSRQKFMDLLKYSIEVKRGLTINI